MQRYTPSSQNTNDWRFLGSAISDATATIADWTDNFSTSGFTGATCGPTDCGNSNCASTCTFVSVYSYDETISGDLDQGYTAATNVTNSIVNGTGYWVYLGASPLTFDITGAPNKSDQTLPVNFTANFGTSDDGWNLVSNPYPCAIDWDAATNATHWDKVSMDDAIYIYNSTTGTYAYHCPVDSSPINGNGGTQYIASQQAFWVHSNTDIPAPVLIARELVKASAQNPTFFKIGNTPNSSHYPSAFKDFPVPLNANNTPGRLKLTASGNGYDDEIFIHFKQGATNGIDNKYDAWKLGNPNSAVHNFSSVMNGNQDLAVNGLPSLTSDVNIPLRLTVPATGIYTISRDNILMLPLSSCIILEDTKDGSMINLRTISSYSFAISDTTVAPRFILHVYAPITKKSLNATCSYSSNGMAIATGIGSGPWNYTWKDSDGNILKTTSNSSASDTLFNCLSGTYSVTVNGAVCGTVTDTIQVNAPNMLNAPVLHSDISCFGGINNGSAMVAPSGGIPSYSYMWSNGESTSALSNLALGNYSVAITDSRGCIATAAVNISQPAALVANIASQTNVSCFGGNNGTATIAATGGNSSYSYTWSNSQTTTIASNLSLGNYSVITADAKGCTATTTINITQPSILTNTVSQTNVSCFAGSNGSATVSPSGGTLSYSYLWDNGKTNASVGNLSAGDYAVMIIDGNGCIESNTVTITEPAVLTNMVSQTNVSCFGANDGMSSVTATGGTASYSYLWNNGQTTASISNLSNGNYSIQVTDSKGCTTTATVAITQPGALISGFTANTYTLNIAVGNTVAFTNSSSGANAYQWNFGDASALDASVNPSHSYTAAGTYTVTLISSDGPCSDSTKKTIVISNSNLAAVNSNQSSSSVNVIYDNGEVFLVFALDKTTNVNINVYSMIGEKILSQNNLSVKNDKVKLNLPNNAVGIYIAVSEMTDAVISKKIFISTR